jgi:hypothetical protein
MLRFLDWHAADWPEIISIYFDDTVEKIVPKYCPYWGAKTV